jgi:hypothetical protein
MALRDVFLKNLHWKLTALVLALIVWLGIKFAIYREATGGQDQVLRRQPVMVLKAPEDTRVFRVDPPHVVVVVQGTKELSSDDVQVFVDLTQMPEVNTALKQVIVRAADSTKVRAEPSYVTVERVTSAESPVSKKP